MGKFLICELYLNNAVKNSPLKVKQQWNVATMELKLCPYDVKSSNKTNSKAI